MPTSNELKSLISKCTIKRTTLNGVDGWAVTGKDEYASKGIFLPTAGYGSGSNLKDSGSEFRYWSSLPSSSQSYSDALINSDSLHLTIGNCTRYMGYPVRPVRKFAE